MSLYDSVLITGGNGMLAFAVKEALAARGIPFASVGRAECDLADVDAVARTFDRVKPTLVLNCAAYTNVDGCETDPTGATAGNTTAPGNLAKACRAGGAALVHYSTDYVFDGKGEPAADGSGPWPWRINDPVAPLGAYGRSKLAGEQLLQEHAPARWVIARTQWLYGPSGKHFVDTMLNAARAGKPLKVVADQIGSPTYTPHLAAATLDVLDRGGQGIWHLSNSGRTSWFGFTEAIMAAFDVTPASLVPATSAEWKQIRPQAAHRPAWSVFDLTPYEALIGKPMPRWQDGLTAYAGRR
ncbi:MAG: dTDP-4-dehydrorhamnose reductase [Phycisphaerales bacterium]|nr:dTDP-4-dehydrorhamnose reductase [Phycisphaerales bacterium]